MSKKIPNTPFSTRLSGSAKETELRLRSIFQWKKKRPPVILFILTVAVLFACFGLVSCEPEEAPEKLMANIEQWIAEYPWAEYSDLVEEGEEWIVETVTAREQQYDGSDVYDVDCISADGKHQLSVALLVDPDTQEVLDMESYLLNNTPGSVEEEPVEDDNEPEPDKEPDAEPEEPKPEVRYTTKQFAFPGSTLGTAFTVQLEWPEGWRIDDYDGSGEPGEDLILSRDAICGADGSLIGAVGYNTFETYEGEVDPDQYYQTVYSGIRLGAHYFWEDFSLVAATDGGETHRATVYYQKDNGGSAASWPTFEADGICSYDKELAVYVALEFQDGAVEDEVLFHIAESIRIEPVESPMDAYERNGRLATVDGISHMPLDELPQEVLDSLTLVSEGDFDGFYPAEWGYRRTYTAPGLEIITTAPSAAYLDYLEEVSKGNRALFPTEEEFWAYIEGEEGREWLTGVTITDDKFATLDGLRVGVTCEQAEALGYSLQNGQNQIGNVEVELSIIVENDTVVQMETWWTMGRYIGKFFEL